MTLPDSTTIVRLTCSSRHTRKERLLATLTQLVKSGGITVKTKNGLTTFGQGLGDDEVRYLHSVVRRALTGDRAA